MIVEKPTGNPHDTYRTFHTRIFVTTNGEFESFETGKYFCETLGNKTLRDPRFVLRDICKIPGVEAAWSKNYETSVRIGRAFSWDGDGIEAAVTEILARLEAE